MTVFTDTWDSSFESDPSDTDQASAGAGDMRQTRVAVKERLEVDHSMAGDADDGSHKKITFVDPLAADPSTVADQGFLYTKNVSTVVELFWKDESGNVTQLTTLGKLKGATLVGEIRVYCATTAPTGWLLCDGDNIGDVGSGADTASADNEDLFTLLWNNFANAELAVSTGRGASAAADWSAGKTIDLPDMRGRVVAGKDDLGGTGANRLTSGSAAALDGDTMGKAGGVEEHQITETEMPSHLHSVTKASGQGVSLSNNQATTGRDQSSQSTGSTGGDTAHTNVQPTIILAFIIAQ